MGKIFYCEKGPNDLWECTVCHEQKPLDAFYLNKKGKYKGHRTYGSCKPCIAERVKTNPNRQLWAKRYTETHREENRARSRARNLRLRNQILDHYGRRCRCCGETEEAFLALDHVNGGGNKHRREIKGGHSSVYYWVITHNFPKDFQILCHNCNVAKGNRGLCPHQGRVD